MDRGGCAVRTTVPRTIAQAIRRITRLTSGMAGGFA
jgi:hypothetical protein